MRKLIASINMTIDGYCDHTAMTPDEEVHQHYTDLLKSGDTILYGRSTYELMGYWQSVLSKPTGIKTMDDFARAMDKIQKIVFSHTLKTLNWNTARLAEKDLKEEVLKLKQENGKPIFVGSPGLIVQLTDLNLIDEYQICILPVIIGKGLPLFKNLHDKKLVKLTGTKRFSSGAIILYYQINS